MAVVARLRVVHDVGMRKDGRDGKNRNDKSDPKNSQESFNNADRLLPPRGDYQTLLSFQEAEVIYDIIHP